MKDVVLSTPEVRQHTGWSLAKIRGLIKSGRLPAVNTSIGQRPTYAVRLSDLERLLTPAGSIPSSQRGSRYRIDRDVDRVFG